MRWVLAVGLCTLACGREAPAPAAPPAETRPDLGPWRGPVPSTNASFLDGATTVAVVDAPALASWLDLPLGSGTATLSLDRPHPGGTHHRIVWTPPPNTSWRDVVPGGRPCDVGSCVAFGRTRVFSRAHEGREVVDVYTGDGPPAVDPTSSPRAELASLRGHLVARTVSRDENSPLREATVEVSTDRSALRLTWIPRDAQAFRSTPSTGTAISWDALCSGAVACARLGPVPPLAAWLRDQPRVDDGDALGWSTWATQWPALLARQVDAQRARLPEMARGMFDNAADGLGEIAFGGGRRDADGTYVAFVRLPSTWVNFTASVLHYLALPLGPQTVGQTSISWAPLPRGGGVFLALDEGAEPTMGWLGIASSPERFAWLLQAPHSGAPLPGLSLHVARLETVQPWLPEPLRSTLQPVRERSLTARIEPANGALVVTAVVE